MTDLRRRVTLADLLASGELSGYARGEPRWSNPANRHIDLQVCAGATCAVCRHQGLAWVPFVRPGSYRAFACCIACGHAEEF